MENRFWFWMEFLFSRVRSSPGGTHFSILVTPRCSVPSLYSTKLLTTRFYSTSSKKAEAKVVQRTDREICQLDPNWVTGFVDGEGCFHVAVRKNENLKLGWEVMPGFTIVLHNKDKHHFLSEFKNLFRWTVKFIAKDQINFSCKFIL